MCVIIDGDDGKFEVHNDDGECARADFFFSIAAQHTKSPKNKSRVLLFLSNIYTHTTRYLLHKMRAVFACFPDLFFQEGFQDRPTGVKTAISLATPKIYLT